jgi:hypothetical protein
MIQRPTEPQIRRCVQYSYRLVMPLLSPRFSSGGSKSAAFWASTNIIAWGIMRSSHRVRHSSHLLKKRMIVRRRLDRILYFCMLLPPSSSKSGTVVCQVRSALSICWKCVPVCQRHRIEAYRRESVHTAAFLRSRVQLFLPVVDSIAQDLLLFKNGRSGLSSFHGQGLACLVSS